MRIENLMQLQSLRKTDLKKVTLSIQSLTEEENAFFETEINNNLNECGCASGMQFVKVLTPFLIVSQVGFIASNIWSPLSSVVSFLCFVFLIAVVGKHYGKYKSTHTVNRIIENIAVILEGRESSSLHDAA